MNGLAKYFDISERDRLNIAFRSLASDKTMLFSGPPTFDMLGSTIVENTISTGSDTGKQHIITPLAFSNSFMVNEGRGGSAEFPVIGSQETFQTPSTTGRISIGLAAYSLVSGDPNSTTAATSEGKKFTLLKRLYNDLISYDGGKVVKHFIADGKPTTDSGFKPIAASIDDLFLNFAHSEFYELEFGLLRVTLTKGNEGVIVAYYENCKLTGGVSDSVRAGGQATFQPQLQMTAAREVPLKWDLVKSIASSGSSETADFMSDLEDYLHGTSAP